MTAIAETNEHSVHLPNVGQLVAPIESVSVKRYGRDTVRTVTIRCPYCTRRHTHGWPEGDAAPGFRRPHCDDRTIHTPDYYIAAPAAKPAPASAWERNQRDRWEKNYYVVDKRNSQLISPGVVAAATKLKL
ncbi:MAG: hypothetical protein WCB92_26585 [Mycobacterium sp.]